MGQKSKSIQQPTPDTLNKRHIGDRAKVAKWQTVDFTVFTVCLLLKNYEKTKKKKSLPASAKRRQHTIFTTLTLTMTKPVQFTHGAVRYSMQFGTQLTINV